MGSRYGSNSMSNTNTVLANLAQRINDHDKARRACEVKGVMHGLRMGQLLIDAKKVVPHGQWLGWLEENTNVSPRMCQIYMKVSKWDYGRKCFEHEYETISHLTINKAVKLIREKESLKTTSARIEKVWTRAQKKMRQSADRMAEVRGRLYEGDDKAFTQFLESKCSFTSDFAGKVPGLLDAEYDADAWNDAVLVELETNR